MGVDRTLKEDALKDLSEEEFFEKINEWEATRYPNGSAAAVCAYIGDTGNPDLVWPRTGSFMCESDYVRRAVKITYPNQDFGAEPSYTMVAPKSEPEPEAEPEAPTQPDLPLDDAEE